MSRIRKLRGVAGSVLMLLHLKRFVESIPRRSRDSSVARLRNSRCSKPRPQD